MIAASHRLPAGSGKPTRLIARAMSEFLLQSARAWARPHGGNLMTAIIYYTVLSANQDHAGYERADGGVAEHRPLSANAVAQSLSLPYETVRRHVSTMIADGRLARLPEGLVAVPHSSAAPAIAAAMTEVREALDELTLTVLALDFDLAQVARMAGVSEAACAAQRPSDAVVAHIVLAGQIRSLESAAPLFGDLLTAYVFAAIVAANVRDLLTDPQLAWRYATQEALPPDHLRRPITVRELSREIELPFETVRRQVRTLLDKGVAVKSGAGGVIIPAAVVASEEALQNHVKLMIEFTRMIGSLARAGYRF